MSLPFGNSGSILITSRTQNLQTMLNITSGDCYYTQSQYTQALDSYEGLLDKYPRGNKVPTTLLKIAFTKIAQKDNRAARIFLNRVIETYPNTEEAKLAQMRLELMPEQ